MVFTNRARINARNKNPAPRGRHSAKYKEAQEKEFKPELLPYDVKPVFKLVND